MSYYLHCLVHSLKHINPNNIGTCLKSHSLDTHLTGGRDYSEPLYFILKFSDWLNWPPVRAEVTTSLI